MEYYFLKGVEKFGPYSIEDLSKEKIDDETFFWFEGQDEWKKLKDLPELRKQFLFEKGVPPPIPKEITKKVEEEIALEIKKERKGNSRTAIKWLLSLLSLSICTYMFFTLAEENLKEAKNQLLAKIDLIFQGKTAACDGEKYKVEGELTKLKEPLKPKENDPFVLLTFQNKLKEYYIKKEAGIVDEFTLTNGGFSVNKITKEDDGYIITKTQAANMVYIVDEYEYYNDGFGGYKLPSYRPSIEECYSSTLGYLTNEDKEGCYTPNTYTKIENFPLLTNDFFTISNVKKPTNPFSDHWWSSGYQVYTKHCKVYLKSEGRYYEIVKIENTTNELYIKYIGMSIIVGGFLIGLIIRIIDQFDN